MTLVSDIKLSRNGFNGPETIRIDDVISELAFSGMTLEYWEARLILDLSIIYCNGLYEFKDENSIEPFEQKYSIDDLASRRRATSDKIEGLF